MVTHRLTACALLLCLAGCAATESRFTATGQPIPAPPGWVDYCRRTPHDPGCAKANAARETTR